MTRHACSCIRSALLRQCATAKQRRYKMPNLVELATQWAQNANCSNAARRCHWRLKGARAGNTSEIRQAKSSLNMTLDSFYLKHVDLSRPIADHSNATIDSVKTCVTRLVSDA